MKIWYRVNLYWRNSSVRFGAIDDKEAVGRNAWRFSFSGGVFLLSGGLACFWFWIQSGRQEITGE